jgi:NO-binding membrane sensor protein with MHYT domain/nitrogen-specific signal transduction histidine kinase
LPGSYDLSTVFLSLFIATLAGFVAFEALEHSRHSQRPALWTTTGGLTLGLGIWSMHFIGMLAWRPPFPLYYSLSATLLSVLLSIAASTAAMHFAVRTTASRIPWVVPSGIALSIGITAMHYVGMDALRFNKPMQWDAADVVVSIVIAVGAAIAAASLLVRASRRGLPLLARVAGAAGLGLAICCMHYLGMHAMRMAPGTVGVHTKWSFSGPMLGRIGVDNAGLFALCLLIVLYHDKERWSRLAYEARLHALDVARQAEKLAVAGRMSASIAHEINNPLEAVTNLLYLLEYSDLGEEDMAYLMRAQEELQRISEITTHTLKFYRHSSAAEPTLIPELFESCLVLFNKRMREAGIVVEKQWPASLPPVLCHSSEIRQVLANLVGNAIDAMTPCDRLSPNASGTVGGTLRLSIQSGTNGLEIEVADTGKGIPPALHLSILQPFFTTKGAAGTGLGLSISAEILERHGGRMSFVSRTDADACGTCFRLFLPYGEDPVPNTAIATGEAPTVPSERMLAPVPFDEVRAPLTGIQRPQHPSIAHGTSSGNRLWPV